MQKIIWPKFLPKHYPVEHYLTLVALLADDGDYPAPEQHFVVGVAGAGVDHVVHRLFRLDVGHVVHCLVRHLVGNGAASLVHEGNFQFG